MLNPSSIREHMEVLGADGMHVGTVDRVEGARVKLTRSDPVAEGHHHFVDLDEVEKVDSKVHLNKTSSQLFAAWKKH